MAKAKRAATKTKTKKNSRKRWCVDIIESERGWGERLDETKTFSSKSASTRFVKKFNSFNTESEVPDWYMYAREPYRRNA